MIPFTDRKRREAGTKPSRGCLRLVVCTAFLASLPAWAQDAGDGPPASVKPNPLGVLDTSKFNDKISVSPYPELLKGPLPSAGEAEPEPPQPAPAVDPEASAPQAAPAPAGQDTTSAGLPTGSVAEPAAAPSTDKVPSAAVIPATPSPPEPSTTTISKDHDKAWAPVQQPIDTVDAQRFRQKARAAIAIGDIAAARALLDGLAARHDPEASFLMAQTYDPTKLSEWGVIGVEGDSDRASNFYRRASEGGYPAPGNGSFK